MNTPITKQWIHDLDLREVFERLIALQQRGTPVDDLMADVVKRLVSCEIKTGGPYGADGVADLETNRIIHQFLVSQAVELPGLRKYIGAPLGRVPVGNKPKVNSLSSKAGAAREVVFEAVHDDLSEFTEPTYSQLIEQVSRIHRADKSGEISLLSKIFNDSLQNFHHKLSDDYIVLLGIINVYCWLAYTIYDNVIDEAKDCKLVPIANLVTRRALRIYNQTTTRLGFSDPLLEESFEKIDQANLWELNHCRVLIHNQTLKIHTVPDFGERSILAQRAYAHIIGPLTIVGLLPDIQSDQITSVKLMLEHYLIARQLNDDIHDWQDDLINGQITYPLSVLLRSAQIPMGTHTLASLSSRLQKQFWNTSLVETSQIALQHIRKARGNFEDSKLFSSSCALLELFEKLESSITQGLVMHASQKKFLNDFSVQGKVIS